MKSSIQKAFIITMILLLSGALLPASPVLAAPVTVTTTTDELNGADGGACASANIADYGTDISLREAICWANNSSGADTIDLPAGTYLLNIAGSGEDSNATGDLDIRDDLTINGDGAIVSGLFSDRVFHIVTPDITVNLNDIQIQQGFLNQYGAGLYNNRGFVTLTDSSVTDNDTLTGGGGIYTIGGSLTLDNSEVSDNTAVDGGGGIGSVDTTLTITNGSVVSNNQVDVFGGGIFHVASQGTAEVTVEGGSEISGNTAGEDGGGIYIAAGGALTVRDSSVIQDNEAQYDGGGIYMDSSAGQLTIQDSSFVENVAGFLSVSAPIIFDGRGGHIWNATDATISNTTFDLGGAFMDTNLGYGGGIYNSSSGNMQIEGSEFGGCLAFNMGGGIYNAGDLTISNSVFNQNAAPLGGGMFDTGSLTISDSEFNENFASEGGGLVSEANTKLTGVTFYRNEADYGGGMQAYQSSPTLTDVTFSENIAYIVGGGMDNWDNSSPTLTNVTFSRNIADLDGGGMVNEEDSNPTLTNVTFSGNSAYYFGGGMDNWENSSPILTNVTFSGNIAKDGGGMINETDSSPTLTNVTFRGNQADETGGAIANLNDSSPKLRNVILWGNTAPTDPEISNDIAAVPDLPDGIPQSDGIELPVPNPDRPVRQHPHRIETPADEPAPTGAGEADPSIIQPRASIPDILYSVVQGGCPIGSTCTNIITDDPLLSPLADNGGFTQTMALGAGSPAIDAGNAAVCPADDQRGITRPQGTGCDIGAYEYVPSPTNAESLPATGFAPAMVTTLPAQPADKAYASTDLLLSIPELGEEMEIVGVPLADGEWDTSWLGQSAGWLEGSAFPTLEGNTILTGHVWDANNNPGPFAQIKDLQHGDTITITAWGQTYTYEVRESSIVFPGKVDKVFQHEEFDYLTLLTCEYYNPLSGNYLFRRVVRAVLVEVD